jgi:group I intron endonuclease
MPIKPRTRPLVNEMREIPPRGGLYSIENTVTHNIYVGSTVNLRKRWQLHLHLLRNGKHHSFKLQASWNKYGEDSFRFIPISIIEDKSQWVRLEQHFISTLKPTYNVSLKAGSCAGIKRSPETIAKIREYIISPERLERFVKMAKKPKSPEHRSRIAAAHRGMKASEETKAKLRSASAKRWGRG